jgi:hypothetical protein
MRKVMPPTVTLNYSNKPECERQLSLAYSRIFMIAKRNILARRNLQQKGGENSHYEEVLHLRSSSLSGSVGARGEDAKTGSNSTGSCQTIKS